MIYAVVIKGDQTHEQRLGDALGSGHLKQRNVYVVGIHNAAALACALGDKDLSELEDPDADVVLQFAYTELIGAENEYHRQQARNRVAQLQKDDTSFLTRVHSDRIRFGL